MNINTPFSDNLRALTEGTGAAIEPDRNNATAANRGVTIPGVGTYYFIPDTVDDEFVHLTLRWAAAVAGTITLETTDYPSVLRDGSTVDVSDFQASGQDWDPEAAGIGLASVAGTGNSLSGLTLTLGGTNAGKARFNLYNLASRRLRVKLVASAGGIIRVACNGMRGAI